MASNQQTTIEVVGKDSASGVLGKIGSSVDGLQDKASRGGLRDFLNGFADGARRAITESDNLNAASERAGIAGLRWTEIATSDLAADAARYPNVTLSGNRVQTG